MSCFFSIITPCYNSFDLMRKFFVSLENQSYKNFEVIVIDDCSTDDSYRRLLNYCNQAKISIRVLQTNRNSGPGCARNLGIDAAIGDWITFIDNDDWISVDCLEKVNNIVFTKNVNSIICDYYSINGDCESKKMGASVYGVNESCLLSVEDAIFRVRDLACGKFYNLKIFKSRTIKFPENIRRCEDIAFVARALDACGSVYYLHEPVYYYLQRQSSLSNNKKMGDSDCRKAFSIIEDALLAKYPKAIKEKSVPVLLYGVLLLKSKNKASKREICDYLDEYEKTYPDWSDCEILGCIGRAKFFFLKAAKLRIIWMLRFLTYVHTKLIG